MIIIFFFLFESTAYQRFADGGGGEAGTKANNTRITGFPERTENKVYRVGEDVFGAVAKEMKEKKRVKKKTKITKSNAYPKTTRTTSVHLLGTFRNYVGRGGHLACLYANLLITSNELVT